MEATEYGTKQLNSMGELRRTHSVIDTHNLVEQNIQSVFFLGKSLQSAMAEISS